MKRKSRAGRFRLIDVSIISARVLQHVVRPSIGRPSSIGGLFIQPPGIIADRVSITAAAIIGLVLLLFIYGREATVNPLERDVGLRRDGER